MSTLKKKYATVGDIKTHSNRISKQLSQHKIYLMLSYLEMKKNRLDKEKLMILKRLETIQKNYEEIDKDKEVLLEQHPQQREVSERISSIRDNKKNGDPKFVIKY